VGLKNIQTPIQVVVAHSNTRAGLFLAVVAESNPALQTFFDKSTIVLVTE